MPSPKWRKSPDPLFAAVDTPHFPAQSLAALNPALQGKPFAVVEQDAESHKTPIQALSRAAREMNVRPGTPVFIARRRWPSLQIVLRDVVGEKKLRKTMEALFLNYTPVFAVRENAGALLDMMGTPSNRNMAPQAWGKRLQADLRSLGLESISIGVASSQTVARVLARRNQSDDIQVCAPGKEQALLDPLSPELLPTLSPHCRERLRKYGLVSILNIRRLGKEELTLRFGGEGEKLYTLVRGLDFETVAARSKPISVETVLSKDLNDQETLRNQVRLTADKLGHALRLQEVKAGRVTLVLTYSDKKSVRKTTPLTPPTAAFLELAEKAVILFEALYQRRVALRSIQLQVAVSMRETGQLNLFDTDRIRKQEALELAIDRIRTKRSFLSVMSGSNVIQ